MFSLFLFVGADIFRLISVSFTPNYCNRLLGSEDNI